MEFVIVALVLGTCMSLLMTAVNAGVGPWFISAWLSAYYVALISIYASALVGILTGIPLTKAILHIPKDAA
jgi:hypothetical protein